MAIYILTNPSFKDNWVKIGKSSRPVDVRSNELDNTAVPLPFEVYAVMKTDKYNEAERQIHRLIDIVNPSMRIRKGREFFNVTPETALRIFQECALMLDDAEIVIADTNTNGESNLSTNSVTIAPKTVTPHNQYLSYTPKATRLTFAMLGIPVGSELTFIQNPNIKAHTIDDQNMIILDDGTRCTLSKAVAIIKRNLGTATQSEAYQGGNFWLYNGEKLTSIRNRLES